MIMKVCKSCEGCMHCSFEFYNDSGSYDPGYYCDLHYCPEIEEDYNAEIVGYVEGE